MSSKQLHQSIAELNGIRVKATISKKTKEAINTHIMELKKAVTMDHGTDEWTNNKSGLILGEIALLRAFDNDAKILRHVEEFRTMVAARMWFDYQKWFKVPCASDTGHMFCRQDNGGGKTLRGVPWEKLDDDVESGILSAIAEFIGISYDSCIFHVREYVRQQSTKRRFRCADGVSQETGCKTGDDSWFSRAGQDLLDLGRDVVLFPLPIYHFQNRMRSAVTECCKEYYNGIGDVQRSLASASFRHCSKEEKKNSFRKIAAVTKEKVISIAKDKLSIAGKPIENSSDTPPHFPRSLSCENLAEDGDGYEIVDGDLSDYEVLSQNGSRTGVSDAEDGWSFADAEVPCLSDGRGTSVGTRAGSFLSKLALR